MIKIAKQLYIKIPSELANYISCSWMGDLYCYIAEAFVPIIAFLYHNSVHIYVLSPTKNRLQMRIFLSKFANYSPILTHCLGNTQNVSAWGLFSIYLMSPSWADIFYWVIPPKRGSVFQLKVTSKKVIFCNASNTKRTMLTTRIFWFKISILDWVVPLSCQIEYPFVGSIPLLAFSFNVLFFNVYLGM